jgi:hypothetical protein
LDNVIENAPTFGESEDSWLKEQSQAKMMQVLTK